MADYPGRVTKTAFSRSAGACPPQSPAPHENAPSSVARGPVPRDANCLNQDFQYVQDGAGFSRFARFTGFFLSPSVQDQAILRYREGWCGGGRRALLRLGALSVRLTLARDRPSPYVPCGDCLFFPVARGPVPRNLQTETRNARSPETTDVCCHDLRTARDRPSPYGHPPVGAVANRAYGRKHRDWEVSPTSE